MNTKIIKLAKILWDYHKVNNSLERSDCIFVLGSHDLRVAERGVELFFQKLADLILFSGGLGNLTKGVWDESEADKFSRIAIESGVPKEKILVENKSTNTGENITFSFELLKSKKISVNKMILVQKPYMERRTYATFMKQWPQLGTEIFVTSPQISFSDYPTAEIPIERVINIMVGDLQRIKEYPEKGYQIYQEIPDYVWDAYTQLVELGYTQHLI